jgi:DNA-binding transcriptional LysR family regulator
MLDGIDSLIALERFGTVSEAAVRLRLTQSAVSKRIQALERTVGFKLVEPAGRRLRLTAAALDLVERARPLVADLRGLTSPIQDSSAPIFSLALADSIASSWGPAVIRRALQELKGIHVHLHAHRSVLLVESIRLGRYHIGLSTDLPAAKDLIHYPVIDEPLVLVHSALSRQTGSHADRNLPLISIEPSSATWSAIEPQIRELHPHLLERPLIPVETFSATIQMVKAGFGDGLVPLGMAVEMSLSRRCYREIRGVRRHISLITRKTINGLAGFRLLREQLVKEAARYFSGKVEKSAPSRARLKRS